MQLCVLLAGCACSPERASQRPPASPPPAGYAQAQPGVYPNAPPAYPNNGYPNTSVPPPPSYSPGAPVYPNPPAPAYPVLQPPAAAPAVRDPIILIDLAWLRAQSTQILNELVQALPAASQQRVTGIPLVFDDTVGEVNAFAACDGGRSLMAISDGLLEIAAWLAQAQAYDSLFQARKTDEYIAFVAQHQRPNQPIVKPPAEFIPSSQQYDGRKLALQHQVFEELVAFVLGHELGHHYLSHLPCTGQPGPLGAAELGRVLSSAVPLFNQPNELAADWEGTKNVLSAGARRGNAAHWTEAGGLLMMRFFAGIEGMSVLDIVFAFERSHPPPNWRVPLIQQSAYYWRTTGGVGLPAPRLGG